MSDLALNLKHVGKHKPDVPALLAKTFPNSSALFGAVYDGRRKILAIAFNRSKANVIGYQYLAVPKSVWLELCAEYEREGGSVGKFYGERIAGVYESVKVLKESD